MNFRPRTVVLVCLVLAAIFGFTWGASIMARTFIGLDPSGFPAGELMQKIGLLILPSFGLTIAGLALTIGSILAIFLVTFFWVRSSVRSQLSPDEAARRSFLTGSASAVGAAAGAAAVGGATMVGRAFFGLGTSQRGWWTPINEIFQAEVTKTHPDWKLEWRGSQVASYGRLGRTEWKVSDTVLGTGPLQGEEGELVVKLAIERGINYLDTSPDYSGSGSEQIVGRALQGLRDKIFLATKFCTSTGHLPVGSPVSRYKEVIEQSLGRLKTDHVDLIHVHSCDEIDRLMDPNMHEAFDRLKEEGKARFLGFSSHTPNLIDVANQAIDSGRFDVMMLAYHHGLWPKLHDVVHRARTEQDMGVVAMKTLKGARHRGLEDFSEYADSYAQAALKWVHADPDISCAIISFFELQHVDEYLYASGKKLSEDDLAILREYDRQVAGTYCSPHCGACLDSCPEGLPIADVLRQRMYFEDYGAEKIAMGLYAKLEKDASACAECSAPCAGSCPYQISIQDRMTGAHELLRFG